MSEQKFPISQKLLELDTKEFWLTGALWDTGYGASFEIGIRCKKSGMFWLQQGWNDAKSMEYAAHMIKAALDAGLGLDCVRGAWP